MRLLLDTNVLLWTLSNDSRLSDRSIATLRNEASEKFVSVVTLAEMQIKKRIGKLDIPDHVEIEIAELGFSLLPLLPAHTPWLSELPLHHRDPFDRMLIAQAIEEGMTIITSDEKFERYPVSVIRN
jgi:PIN domain nuclease of toxin-antitoxin system